MHHPIRKDIYPGLRERRDEVEPGDYNCQKRWGGGGGRVVALTHKNAGRTSICVLEREGVRGNQEIITVRRGGG